LKIGFVQRTKRGRVASPEAAQHIGLKLPNGAAQERLF